MRDLYPASTPFEEGDLKVSPRHTIHYWRYGNPVGQPVVFLHGGPGGCIGPDHHRFFDPAHYHVVLFDQRGCGQSRPLADVVDNTTQTTLADIEALRQHVGVERWQVFGGSWGSTLALAYAQAHPARVTQLVMRGMFLSRQQDLHWLYQEGASHVFPEVYEPYAAFIPIAERHDLIGAYHRRLHGDDEAEKLAAARLWSNWEFSISSIQEPNFDRQEENPSFLLPFARLESHYFVNGGFLAEGELLQAERLARIQHIPAVLIHGRYDMVCCADQAWALKKAWPELDLQMVNNSGHASSDPATRTALLDATDLFRTAP